MTEELKPCLRCGSERPHLAYAQKKPKQKYRIECECGWHGPVRDMIPEAIAAWNQRAKPHLHVDQLANIIRAVDGDNTMGAGELATAIVTSLEGYDD